MSENDRLLDTAIEHHKLAIETYDRRETRFYQWFYVWLLAQSILFAAFTGWIKPASNHHTTSFLTPLVGLIVAAAGLALSYLWRGHTKRFKAKSSALQRTILWLENEIKNIDSDKNIDDKATQAKYIAILQKQWYYDDRPEETVTPEVHTRDKKQVKCYKSKAAKYLFGPPCVFITLWGLAAVYSLILIICN